MSTRTKIIVIRKKELILGAVICGFILLLILLLAGLFKGSPDAEEAPATVPESSARYAPGIYTSTVVLNDSAMEVKVVLDRDHINSVSLASLDDAVKTMVPLVSPAMASLSRQIVDRQSADDVTYAKDSTYTSMILHQAIKDALQKGLLDKTA